MECAHASAPGALTYRLADTVRIAVADGRIVVSSPSDTFALDGLPDAARDPIARVDTLRAITPGVEEEVFAAGGAAALALLYAVVARLASASLLRIDAGDGIASLIPISRAFSWNWAPLPLDAPVRLSRFAYARRGDDGALVLESPLAHARLVLHAPAAFEAVARLANGASPNDVARAIPGVGANATHGLLTLIARGGFTTPADDADRPGDDEPALRSWEFHDLLFHTRSRAGRTDAPLGGTFRFGDTLPPAVKHLDGAPFIALPRTDLAALAATDPSLVGVMESRTSVRGGARSAITLDELATFLYRTARIKDTRPLAGYGDFTSRPYPSAGAGYELELYLTIARCAGVAPGFYWYDAARHGLALVHPYDERVGAIADHARNAMASESLPDVVVTIAARFARVAWKYQSIAYALILKNTGVLIATMYYVATAMGLAPCAIGTGDSDLFARVAGTGYFEETSVGEFVLGGSA